jgi:hypothetical protein
MSKMWASDVYFKCPWHSEMSTMRFLEKNTLTR